MIKCSYFLCDCVATRFFDDDEDLASCNLHFNIRIGEELRNMENEGMIKKTWNEESNQYLYSLINQDFLD